MTEQRRLFELGDIVVFSDEAFPPLLQLEKYKMQQAAALKLTSDWKLRVVNVRASTDWFFPKRRQQLRVDPIDARLARTKFWIDCRLYGKWWDDTWFRLAGS